MIGPDGFINWAKRIDGVADKVYTARNSGEWITCHSIVGGESEFDDGVPNRFLDRSRNADGSYTANAAASVMFVLRLNGQLIQMYPIWASTWTSGGREANTRSWAIEAEGGFASNPGEKLTEAQVVTFIRLAREWEAWSGKKAIPGSTLLQHKDVAKQFGYAATACASDRYSEAWARVAKGEDSVDGTEYVTRAELDRLIRRIFNGQEGNTTVENGMTRLTTEEERIATARWRFEQSPDENQSILDLAASANALAKQALDRVELKAVLPDVARGG
jgi:hypothetical protein